MKFALRSLLIGLLGTFPLLGDTVELKSGEKIEGTIKSESTEYIVIETQFSPTIREERRIRRSDIASILKAGPDEESYQKIAAIQIPRTAKTTAGYLPGIATMEKFLADYAYSRHVQKVREKLSNFRGEANRIDAGTYKIDGIWVDADDYDAEPEHYEARSLLSRMKTAASRGDSVAVLNLYDQMEDDYDDMESYPEAAELTLAQTNKLIRTIEVQQGVLKRRLEQRKLGLDRASPNDRARMERAISIEEAQIAKIEEQVKASDAAYPPLVPGSEKLLDELGDEVEKLKEDLEELQLASMLRSAKLTSQARQQLESNQFAQAETSLEEAEAAWEDNEAIGSLRKVLDERRTAFEDASKKEAESVRKAKADEKALEDAKDE